MMPKDFENKQDFESYRNEIDKRMDFDKAKKQQLLAEMYQIVQSNRTEENTKTSISDKTSEDLLDEPYLTNTIQTPEKRWNNPSMLRNLASIAAALVLVSVLAYCLLPSYYSSRLAVGLSSDENTASDFMITADTAFSENKSDNLTTGTSLLQSAGNTKNTGVTLPSNTKVTSVTTNTTKAHTTTKAKTDSNSTGKEDSSSVVKTSSHDKNSSGVGCQGFIWMSIERMRSEIDHVDLHRFYDAIEDDTHSVPTYNFDLDKFYNIIETIKKYDWTEHRGFINANQLKACELTVVGSNTVYTYLVFGRDESGRYFVWSFYDYKIAYLSEKDFGYIEDVFIGAG